MMIQRNAIVVDNNDEDKKDRLKLKIIPEMTDVADDLLPWVSPKQSNNNTDSVNRIIPELDSIVLVDLEDTYETRNMRWSLSTNILDNIIYDDIETNVNNITDKVSDYTYPQPNEYHKFKDGSYSFRNTETGEFVFCHNSGVYTIYDEDGNVTTYTKDKYFKVYNDKLSMELLDTGDYLFTNEKVTLDMKNNGDIKLSNSTTRYIEMTSTGYKIQSSPTDYTSSTSTETKTMKGTQSITIGTESTVIQGLLGKIEVL